MAHWHIGPNPTADMVLFRRRRDGKIDVLLIRRADNSNAHPGQWAVPGGFVETDAPRDTPWRPGRESPSQTVVREVQEETGIDLSALAAAGRIRELEVRERVGRDPRDSLDRWTRTHVFGAVADESEVLGDPTGHDDAGHAAWVPLEEAMGLALAFDHSDMLRSAARVLLQGMLDKVG